MPARPLPALTLAVFLAAGAAAARAESPAPPLGVVGLTASASAEVTKDWLSVTLSTTREGQDANAVQAQLKQALDAALAEARKAARPGQLEVQTGNFSLFPRYAPATNRTSAQASVITGWQGSAELVVEGKDVAAIGQLTGRITTMTIGRVSQGISRELREKVEGDVAAQAIARYRAKAAEVSKQFGYAGYTVREVHVNTEVPPGGPVPMLRAKAMSAAADESLPIEAGKGTVTVTVNGTVQMTK
jgi:predicted secreted protein